MAYPIDSMIQNQAGIDGKWVISRPFSDSFWRRLKDAWLVLIGHADAVTFYKQTIGDSLLLWSAYG